MELARCFWQNYQVENTALISTDSDCLYQRALTSQQGHNQQLSKLLMRRIHQASSQVSRWDVLHFHSSTIGSRQLLWLVDSLATLIHPAGRLLTWKRHAKYKRATRKEIQASCPPPCHICVKCVNFHIACVAIFFSHWVDKHVDFLPHLGIIIFVNWLGLSMADMVSGLNL